MLYVEKIKKKSRNIDIIISSIIFTIIIIMFFLSIQYYGIQVRKINADNLRVAIKRAVVECYATEGRYPPDVKYLEDNYKITIDQSKFDVFYDGFASNIMPDITVNVK